MNVEEILNMWQEDSKISEYLATRYLADSSTIGMHTCGMHTVLTHPPSRGLANHPRSPIAGHTAVKSQLLTEGKRKLSY